MTGIGAVRGVGIQQSQASRRIYSVRTDGAAKAALVFVQLVDRVEPIAMQVQ
jgi:hypothetical protein